MSATTTASLWDLVEEHRRLEAVWRESRREEDRRAMAGGWSIAITAPGAEPFDDGEPLSGRWSRCSPTVLSRDHWPRRPHLEYRGACLGCGWVSPRTHFLQAGGENAAVEDAHDHTHPGWRDLPVVGALPSIDSPTARERAIGEWRARWEPLLPGGWLDRGGPIRTKRSPLGTRHVPGRAPGGGYDLAAAADEREIPGGQLGLF